MAFPILGRMSDDACCPFLMDTLHPDGLRCPSCQRDDTLSVHDRHRAPVRDYRCRHCGTVFNAYTGTPHQKTHRSPT
ncbi:Uncharacterized protein OS=Chloroflexus aggregans (strain MD-66 / DSM 9485) GN=Cagg_0685 PE=4 SV=1: Zn_Tnp_IS1595 [Gemmata massiliana]|uniref:Transposase zinc-ribbon domain-containing protein n=1 Tax=Gemmata massiliana TaxID=1210884 RepID=A0A6P2D8S6_9BACT|nr:transposase [Gemmata massiliana]VTR97618.1 Uncharacterized protein OS=Chloroflexus aggregans (strain MD-66 / DSM 9485) GN=Cagg_0685 PE=4 SV=1: Zn_Tnp_IS1595 [Gemmata massiliana]